VVVRGKPPWLSLSLSLRGIGGVLGKERRIVGLSAVSRGPQSTEWHQGPNRNAANAFACGQDDPDIWVIVKQNLTVPPARADGAPAEVANRDDCCQLTSAGRTGMAKGNQLSARPAGEVVQIDATVLPAIRCPDGCSHGVHAALAIGICIDNLAGEVDEFKIFSRQFPARNSHARHTTDSSTLVRPQWAAHI
jgi:hypothetical protein